jgi:hypothetical protein
MRQIGNSTHIVYRASPKQGLTEISPRISTHGRTWVYATGDLTVAALFLGRLGGDFTCGVGTYGGMPYVVERFAGALNARYLGISGSIYTLPPNDFEAGRTTWAHDLVCDHAVQPISEDPVPNAIAYLNNLAHDGKLLVKRYPERFCIPDDDQDLVYRAVARCKAGRMEILEQLRDWHPHLVDRVRHALLEPHCLGPTE